MARLPVHNPLGEVVRYALVDDADFPRLSQWYWGINAGVPSRKLLNGEVGGGQSRPRRVLHVEVMQTPKGIRIHHINGNRFDCQKANLQVEWPVPTPPGVPGARWVRLTKGLFVLVDVADYQWATQYKWHTDSTGRYAARAIPRGERSPGGGHDVYMHRELLPVPAGIEVDHVNGNGLDNRRANLREATHQNNLWNAAPRGGKRSQYKGVTWTTSGNKWRAAVQGEHIGAYAAERDAARAYDREARRRFGVFARLNFPDEAI